MGKYVDRGSGGGMTEIPDERHRLEGPVWPVIVLVIIGILIAAGAWWVLDAFLSQPRGFQGGG